MNSPGAPDIATATGPASPPASVSAQRPDDRSYPWLRTGPDSVAMPPLAGRPGHGSAAFLRNRPARIVDDRIQGGCNDVYELICSSCGDRSDLEYSEVPPRLQRLRGPRALAEALAAYHQHLGLPWSTKIEPEA